MIEYLQEYLSTVYGYKTEYFCCQRMFFNAKKSLLVRRDLRVSLSAANSVSPDNYSFFFLTFFLPFSVFPQVTAKIHFPFFLTIFSLIFSFIFFVFSCHFAIMPYVRILAIIRGRAAMHAAVPTEGAPARTVHCRK